MFKTLVITILAVAMNALATMAAESATTGSATSSEQRLIQWASRFQAKAADIRGRVAVPSRDELLERVKTQVAEVAAENQDRVQENRQTLHAVAQHGQRVHVHDSRYLGWPTPVSPIVPNGPFFAFAWAPSPDREITNRHAMMLKAWDRARKDQSISRTTDETVRREKGVSRLVAARREQVVQEEARLVRLERNIREASVRSMAQRYAVNWLLGGHPEAYLPARWNVAIRKTGNAVMVPVNFKDNARLTIQDIETLNASVRQLTDLLVSLGMGDVSPDRIVEVEHQLQSDRSQARMTMASLTGQSVNDTGIRLASGDHTDSTSKTGNGPSDPKKQIRTVSN